MRTRCIFLLATATGLLSSCGVEPHAPGKLTVAAAANLTDAFGEIGRAFEAKTGVKVVLSFGSTAQLAQQIENGAPFDVFAAADTAHVDDLVKSGKLTGDSRAVYALGQLAVWLPGEKGGAGNLKDLADPQVRYIAIAQPELAPYGAASVEALKAAGLWAAVKPKLVYGSSINMAREMASSGNADAAFTASSLVLREQGTVVKVDPKLYRPIEQAVAIVSASERMGEAKQFRAFLLGEAGRSILVKNGYLVPVGSP